MFNIKISSISFIFLFAFSLNAESKLYKWVDDHGVTHYGEIIPPEYANKERDSLKKSGMLDKRAVKISPEEAQAKKDNEQKIKMETQAATEQSRRESALLNTYSNEEEIDLALKRSVVLVNARIESNKMLLKSSQDSLDEHKKEFDQRTKLGKKIFPSLIEDIAQSETRVAKFQNELRISEEELINVTARFENDKLVYRRLKGGSQSK
jgi:hypothetical protein